MRIRTSAASLRHAAATGHRPPFSESPAGILLIDDDLNAHSTLGWAFKNAGFRFGAAESGKRGLELLAAAEWELSFIDVRLPDISGIEVFKQCTIRAPSMRCIIISGFLTVPLVVQLTKLGAADVIEKPLEVEVLVRLATELCGHALPDRWANQQRPFMRPEPSTARPGSLLEKWVQLVLKACESEADPRTLQLWARQAGLSYSSLCEHCRLLGLQPHDARDLVRTLRAKLRAVRYDCSPEVLLNVADRRTLSTLLERAGAGFRATNESVEQFLRGQHFLSCDTPAMRRLLDVFRQNDR